MANAITNSDWKLFQERLPEWQEKYIGKLIEEYIALLNGPGNSSDRFWELEKRIKTDRKHPGVIMQIDKGEAVFDIVRLVNLKVITVQDLDGFSDGLIGYVNTLGS